MYSCLGKKMEKLFYKYCIAAFWTTANAKLKLENQERIGTLSEILVKAIVTYQPHWILTLTGKNSFKVNIFTGEANRLLA